MDIVTDEFGNFGRRISVDMGTPIKIELHGIELPLQSSIVGLENEKYLILKAPEPFNRIEHKLFPGNEMIVRYLSDGTVYAFQTKMIATIAKPVPLVFIEYPKIIQHHDLREQKRVSCHIPTRVIIGESENIGCIVDIAKAGCRCIVQRGKNPYLNPYDLDDPITLKCIFPGSKDMITVPGTVKNVKKTKRDIDLGVAFDVEMPLDSQKLIAWFISTIEDFAPRP